MINKIANHVQHLTWKSMAKSLKHAYDTGRYTSNVSQENLESVKHCFNCFHD